MDDTTLVETVRIDDATRHLSTNIPLARSKAKNSEVLVQAIEGRASEIGMQVNCAKTQLLMVSPPNGYCNNAYVRLGGKEIVSSASLKLLGFVFGADPTVDLHVKEIKRKFRARFWALIYLRKAGFKNKELFDLYCVFVRPIIEFCSVVYHSLLTAQQAEELERLQRQAIKLSYGWDRSYQEICASQNIQTLEERRKLAVDRFVCKAAENPRFAEQWFPLRMEAGHEIRDRRIFHETCARTERYHKSPLANMRRRANDLLTA